MSCRRRVVKLNWDLLCPALLSKPHDCLAGGGRCSVEVVLPLGGVALESRSLV